MTQLTSTMVTQLNNMNMAAQRASLGTLVNGLEYGSIPTDAVGTFTPLIGMKYVVAPTDADVNDVLAATLLTTAVQTVTTGITDPDVPRFLSVTGGDANVTGNVVIVGTDINGDAITDTIASSGTSTVDGDVAFASVTSIALPVYAVAGTETISVGVTVDIGLPVNILDAAQALANYFDGSDDAGTVAAGGTLSTSVFAVAGSMDGTKEVAFIILGS